MENGKFCILNLEKYGLPGIASNYKNMIPIRSYKRRQGRMIPSQKRALGELWQEFGVTEQGPLDLEALFGRQAPCHLEIGFGMGEVLLEMARNHPENNYLGVDVYLPGVGQLLIGIREMGIRNIRIDRRDIVEVLALLPAGSVGRVSLLFPDPWPKQRHQKRRLVQAPFVEKLHRVLVPGGHFHAATDWDDYARQICGFMEADNGFSNWSGSGEFYPGPVERPLTKFEKRGLRRGHEVRELLYERI
jgi:tRNA (guanine-N7-)-methyltransferase